MKSLVTTGILTSYRPRADSSFSLSININIPTKEQKITIDELFQQEVVVYLREGSHVTKEETDIIDNVDIDFKKDKKTDHQRLTSVWFILWKENSEGFKLFNDYYHYKMNIMIEHFKGKIIGEGK